MACRRTTGSSPKRLRTERSGVRGGDFRVAGYSALLEPPEERSFSIRGTNHHPPGLPTPGNGSTRRRKSGRATGGVRMSRACRSTRRMANATQMNRGCEWSARPRHPHLARRPGLRRRSPRSCRRSASWRRTTPPTASVRSWHHGLIPGPVRALRIAAVSAAIIPGAFLVWLAVPGLGLLVFA